MAPKKENVINALYGWLSKMATDIDTKRHTLISDDIVPA